MPQTNRNVLVIRVGLLAAAVLVANLSTARAQATFGFTKIAGTSVPNEQIVRQPDLWQMECQLKSMRMVWLQTTDPRTGQTRPEQIWYLPYRCCRRPLELRPDGDSMPRNELDPKPGPAMFLPSADLIVYDSPESEIPTQVLHDRIVPEAMEKILAIERSRAQNSVNIVQPLPPAAAPGAEDEKWLWGVFMFRGVDPEADFFKVIIHGCSNGYEKRVAENGDTQIWRKAIVQKFQRPGDRFDPSMREFQFVGDPQWILIPDNGAAAVINSAQRLPATVSAGK